MFYLGARAGDIRHSELNTVNTRIAIPSFQFGVGPGRPRHIAAMAGEPVVVILIFLRTIATGRSGGCDGVRITPRRRSIEGIVPVPRMSVWIGHYRRGVMPPAQPGEIIVI